MAFVFLFFASSMAVPVTVWPAVFEKSATGGVQESMPLILSMQRKPTTTPVRFHPASFGGGRTPAVIDGISLSTPTIDTRITAFDGDCTRTLMKLTGRKLIRISRIGAPFSKSFLPSTSTPL